MNILQVVPDDILLEICKFLDYSSIIKLSSTSRELYKLIDRKYFFYKYLPKINIHESFLLFEKDFKCQLKNTFYELNNDVFLIKQNVEERSITLNNNSSYLIFILNYQIRYPLSYILYSNKLILFDEDFHEFVFDSPIVNFYQEFRYESNLEIFLITEQSLINFSFFTDRKEFKYERTDEIIIYQDFKYLVTNLEKKNIYHVFYKRKIVGEESKLLDVCSIHSKPFNCITISYQNTVNSAYQSILSYLSKKRLDIWEIFETDKFHSFLVELEKFIL